MVKFKKYNIVSERLSDLWDDRRMMYKVSEEFHEKYADMYDNFVKITFKDGTEKIGLFNDEFYEDSSILVSCEVIKIEDIGRMELAEDEKMA